VKVMPDMRKTIDRTGGLARTAARRAERAGRGTASFVTGKAKAVVNRPTPKPDMDDLTLENKVETVLFRDQDAPKGSVSVNVVNGVVELRGEVKRPELKKDLEAQARAVPEVRDVRNLLHLPKTPAPGRADSPGRQRRKSP
jgi:osmotically-inducible protein OsmY